MPVVVIPAVTGAQQSAIARGFRAAGWQVIGTSRKAGPDIVKADLETGAGLAEAFAGAEAVVFSLPQDHRPGAAVRITTAVARAAAEARVPHLILNMAGRVDETSPADMLVTLRACRDAARRGPVPLTILEPTVFMDNLLQPWSLPGIAAGTLAYPVAADVRVAWISHRTLAEACVAVAAAGPGQGTLRIGGAPLAAGDLTATLAARLGHPVAYAQIPLDGFAAGLNAAMGPPAGDRIAELYAHLAANPGFMTDGAETMAALGNVPETFAAFVARNDWTVPA